MNGGAACAPAGDAVRRASGARSVAALAGCSLLVLVAWGGSELARAAPQAVRDGNIVHVPESRSVEVEAGRAERLAAAGRWRDAVRIWVRLLAEQRGAREGIQHVVALEGGRYESYVRSLHRRLSRLEGPGLQAARALIAEPARAAYERALAALDPVALEAVWRDYPVARAGAAALEAAGDLWYEEGRGELALALYRRAQGVRDSGLDPPRLEGKIEAAAALARRQLQARRRRRARAAPRPWADVDVLASLESPAALGAMRASHPLLPPGRAALRWRRLGAATPAPRVRFGPSRSQLRFADVIPAIEGDRCVVATGRSIACFSLRSGRRLWRQEVWSGEDHNPDLFYGATIAAGRVFAPFVVRVSRAEHYRGIPIKVEIPTRRLVAFDLETGKRLWDQVEAEDPFLRAASIALPPVELAGRLYAGAVLREGQLKNYLVCLDAESGRLLWRRYIGAGQVEMTMFGEHAREPLAMQPLVVGDRLYHATGTGLFACLALPSGDLEWILRYEALPIRSAESYYAIMRRLVWVNTPPVASAGVVIVAPIDAARCYGVDRDSGALRWWFDGQPPSRLAGLHGDRVALLGPGGLVLLESSTGKRVLVAEDEELDARTLSGAPTVVGDLLLLPTDERVQRFDLARATTLLPWLLPGGRERSGSIVFTEPWRVTANPARVTVFSPPESGQ